MKTSAMATPPRPPARCVECDTVPHWRYRDRMRWHCVACAPCPDPDDAVFTWHSGDEHAWPRSDAAASGGSRVQEDR